MVICNDIYVSTLENGNKYNIFLKYFVAYCSLLTSVFLKKKIPCILVFK